MKSFFAALSLLLAGASASNLNLARKLATDGSVSIDQASKVLLGKDVRKLIQEHTANRGLDEVAEAVAVLLCEGFTSPEVTAELPPTTTVTCDTDGAGVITLKFADSSEECEDGQCISNLSLEMTMDLSTAADVEVPTPISMELCVDFVSGFPTLDGGRFCFGLDAELDMLSEEEEEDFAIDSCSATFDGDDCGCQVCNGGQGVNFDCGNALVVRDCTDFTGMEDFTSDGGVSVVSRLATEDSAANSPRVVASILVSAVAAVVFAI